MKNFKVLCLEVFILVKGGEHREEETKSIPKQSKKWQQTKHDHSTCA